VTDADYDTLGAVIATAVTKAVSKATLPLESLIAELETKLAAVQLRAAVPGPAGEKGADGVSGRDGADGQDGKDGRDGIDGKDGAPGVNGKDGADGLNGKDGESIIGPEGTAGRDGRDSTVAGPAGKDGANGRDGKDGLDGTLDGAELVQVDERTWALVRTVDAGQLGVITLSHPLDRGVFRDGTPYQQGDGVSFGGSFFIAQRAVTTERPEDGSGAWRLAVKRGRDGRAGQQGPQGPQGLKGERGEQGRNFS
jgi:integrin beta 3